MTESIQKKLTNALLSVGTGLLMWIGSNLMDLKERITRLETKIESIEKIR